MFRETGERVQLVPLFSVVSLFVLVFGGLAIVDYRVAMTLFTIFTAVGGFVMGWAEVSLRDVRIWWESFPNATHYAIILLFSTSAGMYLYFLFNNYVPKVEVKWIKVNKSSN